MNSILRTTLIVVLVVFLGAGLFFAGMFYASSRYAAWGPGMTLAPGAHLPRAQVPGSAGVGGFGPGGMMHSYGYNSPNAGAYGP
jgi:hypothetical protein